MSYEDIFKTLAAVFVSVGGAGAIFFGLSSYLGKVWANRILESDRARFTQEIEALKAQFEATNRKLQAQLDKRVHVSRIQFETEFQGLQKVWQAIANLRSAMSPVRPEITLSSPNEDYLTRFHENRDRFLMALSEFIKVVDSQSPFYTEEIFRAASDLIFVCKEEELDIRVRTPRQGDWFERGKLHFSKACELSDKISQLIRERLASLELGA